MSLIYAVLLAAVALVVIAEVITVVRRLAAPAPWAPSAVPLAPVLAPVPTADRRQQALPYVGRDRRHVDAGVAAGQRRSA